MATKIKMWEFTADGKLRGVVPAWYKNPHHCIRHVGNEATIETSRIVGVRGLHGQTIVQTAGGSEYQLDGPSRPDLIREAASVRTG